jgi:glycerol-3-phosphate dehydrogenase
MKRQLEKLANKEYDLVVIGGGIFGACAAWDAVLRGLKVALVEKDDFCQGTSANHFKMIHGGMRYLQHLDLPRIRESSRERSILLKTAPHLAEPLPILMPTYGHGLKGKEILRAGLRVYELITFDRNRGIHDPRRRIPNAAFLSKAEVLEEYPGLNPRNLTGAVVFCDGQIYNPPRLVLSYLRSAAQQGLHAANYLEAVDYVRKDRAVQGVVVQDRLTGDRFEIRSKLVLNASGPWAHRLNEKIFKRPSKVVPSFSRDLVMVVSKRLSERYAFAHIAASRDHDALLDRGGRHLFIIPWRNYSLVGVWHQVFNAAPEGITVRRSELEQFLGEINNVYDRVRLTVDDVTFVNTGLILFGTEDDQGGKSDHSFGKRSMLVDHLQEENISGLLTLIGVRATVARLDAERAIRLVLRRLNKEARPSATHATPIHGGNFECIDDLMREAERYAAEACGCRISPPLVRNYGSAYPDVLAYCREDPRLGRTIDGSHVIQAEVVHAVRDEMAVKLEDVVFRRTELGTGANPGPAALEACGRLMALECGWSQEQTRSEIDAVLDIFTRKGPWRLV